MRRDCCLCTVAARGDAKMQTVTLIVVGLIVLAAFHVGGRMIGEGGRAGAATGLRLFLPVWLLASLANLAIAYYVSERSPAIEIVLFVLVFGIPAAAAIWLLRKGRGRL